MIVSYYIILLLVSLFYQKSREGRDLNLITIVMTVVASVLPMCSYITNISLQDMAIINEILNIILALITYKYHKNKFIFVPLTLSLFINYSYSVVASYEYRYFIYDYYNIINIILFEMLLYNCIRYTPIPSKINNISNNMLSYVNEKLRNTNKPQNIHFS